MREITEKEVKLKQQLLESPAHQKVKGELQSLRSTSSCCCPSERAVPRPPPAYSLFYCYSQGRSESPAPRQAGSAAPPWQWEWQLAALSPWQGGGLMFNLGGGGVLGGIGKPEYGTYRALGVVSRGQ